MNLLMNELLMNFLKSGFISLHVIHLHVEWKLTLSAMEIERIAALSYLITNHHRQRVMVSVRADILFPCLLLGGYGMSGCDGTLQNRPRLSTDSTSKSYSGFAINLNKTD